MCLFPPWLYVTLLQFSSWYTPFKNISCKWRCKNTRVARAVYWWINVFYIAGSLELHRSEAEAWVEVPLGDADLSAGPQKWYRSDQLLCRRSRPSYWLSDRKRCFFLFSFNDSMALTVLGVLSVEVAGSHSDTLGSFPLEEWLVRSRDIVQLLQMTDIHAHGEIRTRNPSKRAAADPGLKPHRL